MPTSIWFRDSLNSAAITLMFLIAGQLIAAPDNPANPSPTQVQTENPESTPESGATAGEKEPEPTAPPGPPPPAEASKNEEPKAAPPEKAPAKLSELCPKLGNRAAAAILVLAEKQLSPSLLEGMPKDIQELTPKNLDALRSLLADCKKSLAAAPLSPFTEILDAAALRIEEAQNLFVMEAGLRSRAELLAQSLAGALNVPDTEEGWPSPDVCKPCAEIRSLVKELRRAAGSFPKAAGIPQLATIFASERELRRQLDDLCLLAAALERVDFDHEFAEARYYLRTISVEAAREIPRKIRDQGILQKCQQQ